MTCIDLNKLNIFQLWLYAYQTKARNPGNTEAAKNLMINHNTGYVAATVFLGFYLFFVMH